MWIMAFFTKNGEPAIGLNPLPVIRIREVSNGNLVVADASMIETGDGFYSYDFAAQNTSKDYAFRCDGGTALPTADRYTYGSSGAYDEAIDNIESRVEAIDFRSELIKKIQTNRLELADGSTGNWVLYDDDDTTPLLVWSVQDKLGNLIVQHPHTPSRRSKAEEV